VSVAPRKLFRVIFVLFPTVFNFEVVIPVVFNNDNFFLCITHTVEHNYISPSGTVGIQLHVSALYVGHLQVVI